MSALTDALTRLRRFSPEALLDLRPAYPPVAVEIDRGQVTLVRVKHGKGRPGLEAYRIQPAPEHAVGASIFRPNLGSLEEVTEQVRALFEKSGTKPGRVSVVLPDNLAKVSIVSLPERPVGRRQTDDLLRFKLRRSVPFRLEDAVISSWTLPGPGPGADYLVAVMLRSVVEQYETAFEAVGSRPGLIELCTPSLFNVLRPEIAKAASAGDVAVVNAARTYFTLLIARGDRVLFFRCKSYAVGEGDAEARATALGRELSTSLSYYREKLSGAGIGTVFLRSAAQPVEEIAPILERFDVATIRPVDAALLIDPRAAAQIDPADAPRLAPALGAAMGRVA